MKLYRYSNNVNDSDDNINIHDFNLTVVFLHEFEVTRSTPCGSWIVYCGHKKFVNYTNRKQYAYRTLEEAKVSFLARKKRQIAILTAQLHNAHESIMAIERPSTPLISRFV